MTTVVTTVGRAKLINATIFGTSLELVSVKLGSSPISPSPEHIAVPDVVWSGSLVSLDINPENPTQMIARAVVPVEDGPFSIQSIGLFDSEDALIAIGTLPLTEKFAGGSSVTITMGVAFSSEEVAVINVIPAGPYISTAEKGVPGGVATLDAEGKVPAAQLPPPRNDVQEYEDFSSFPGVGESNTIYIDMEDEYSYFWDGEQYVALGGGVPTGTLQTYTTAGVHTFTVPDILKDGTKKAKVTCVGGGGGASKGNGSQLPPGGGGGGAAISYIDLTGVASVTVTVGAGGTGATVNSSSGSAGGTTSFGAYCSATGGGGGTNDGGAGGNPAGTFDIGLQGGGGGHGITGGSGGVQLGYGGNSPFSGVANARVTSGAGVNGKSPGGGGSAGFNGNGGNGAAGAVWVEW